MNPKGAQTETPGGQNGAPRSPQVTKKTTHGYQGCQNGTPSVTMGSSGPPKYKKNTKSTTKCYSGQKLCCKVAKNKQAHRDTNSKQTKETKRDTKKQTTKQTHKHKQTNERTNKHTNKHPNKKPTGCELQTQTQTPAAGCSPKAT